MTARQGYCDMDRPCLNVGTEQPLLHDCDMGALSWSSSSCGTWQLPETVLGDHVLTSVAAPASRMPQRLSHSILQLKPALMNADTAGFTQLVAQLSFAAVDLCVIVEHTHRHLDFNAQSAAMVWIAH